ncbi:hypothetical protein ACAN107058_10715 [Paracidovorax anthurii]|uniref:Uncharacterized protein n=1 Tax=Paracidovorax anthurii TaxID=78229 RepID=A0A328ZJ46_9BURK|nr:hypothetical protein AX018_1002182 [Paracidovorax anthurii]
MRIQGGVALLKGAGRGLGKAFDRAWLAAGAAKAHATARTPSSIGSAPGTQHPPLDATCVQIRQGPGAGACPQPVVR